MSTTSRRVGRAVGSLAGLGVAVTAWALLEAAAYRLVRVDVPTTTGRGPLRVLHLSDLHLAPWQRRKQAWLRGLAALEPDLTVVTGDMMGHRDAVGLVEDCLGGLLDRPGVFVLGSNDYFAPKLRNPLRYFLGPSDRPKPEVERLPTGDLVAMLTGHGWVDIDNRRDAVEAGGVLLDLVGVDDPHHELDRMPAPAPRAEGALLRLGVAHAPYRRVLDAFAADGAELVLAGHTHGGQICVPGWGALVTNCDLEARYAKGLFAWSAPQQDEDPWTAPPTTWVHVNPGLGTSPYTPIRLACPPEATLLTLH